MADVAEDVIIILSTHIVDDVTELCPNMAIMNQGNMVYKGTPQAVISELNGKVWQKIIERNEVAEYKKNYTVISDKMVAGKPLIHVLNDTNPGAGFESVAPGLEDVFFSKINETKEVSA